MLKSYVKWHECRPNIWKHEARFPSHSLPSQFCCDTARRLSMHVSMYRCQLGKWSQGHFSLESWLFKLISQHPKLLLWYRNFPEERFFLRGLHSFKQFITFLDWSYFDRALWSPLSLHIFTKMKKINMCIIHQRKNTLKEDIIGTKDLFNADSTCCWCGRIGSHMITNE